MGMSEIEQSQIYTSKNLVTDMAADHYCNIDFNAMVEPICKFNINMKFNSHGCKQPVFDFYKFAVEFTKIFSYVYFITTGITLVYAVIAIIFYSSIYFTETSYTAGSN